ncbi:MAG: hypothetical protein Q4E05_09990 [Pseudoclavibacter sp.]|nr:hypothetical protein [Pseudoclavibacter sp.]
MTIYLDGGGGNRADGAAPPGRTSALRRLLTEAADRAAGRPARVAILAPGPDGARRARDWELVLRAAAEAPIDPVPLPVDEGGAPLDPAALMRVDAILVTGARGAACLSALDAVAVDLRRLVAEGVPYYGEDGGAQIAGETAVDCGRTLHGAELAPAWPDAPERSTLAPGLGLVDITILARAAQRGLLALAVALVDSGENGEAPVLAIDEQTILVVGDGALEVLGSGRAWHVRGGPEPGGTLVSTLWPASGADGEDAESEEDA